MKFKLKFKIGDVVSKEPNFDYEIIGIDGTYYSVKCIESGIMSSCHFTFLENGFKVNKKLIRKMKLKQIAENDREES